MRGNGVRGTINARLLGLGCTLWCRCRLCGSYETVHKAYVLRLGLRGNSEVSTTFFHRLDAAMPDKDIVI